MSRVKELTAPFDGAALECDGMTRVLHAVLVRNHVPHKTKIGRVEWNGKHFSPHFWIELPSGEVVDYRLRMWFGGQAPHGVFDPEKAGVIYEGRTANIPVLTDFLFEILAGRPIEAGLKDVVNKIVRRFRDSELARRLSEKVMRYIQTRNPADDLTPQEVSAIYRQEDYGDDFDMPGGQELDVGWTDHAEYRCDLRDVDPSRVNEAVRNFAETHPRKHQKVNLVNRNIGKAVVDVNTQIDPAQAAVVTVMASGNDLKRQIIERAAKVKSAKVKKYVHDGLLRKIDQAGAAAPAWLEKLESKFKNLKPEGLMEGFEQDDFNDLWFVLTGEKADKGKSKTAANRGGYEDISGLCREHRTTRYFEDREGLIGVANHQGGISWYRLISGDGYSLVGESKTSQGAKMHRLAADALLFPGSGDGNDDEDQTHHFMLGGQDRPFTAGYEGDCYEAAGKYMADNGQDGRTILVQGEVTGRGKMDGIKFGHSWIEKGGMVLEVSNGQKCWVPMDLYYTLGKITRTKKYGFREALKWMLKTGHFGPWELKTRL